MKRHAFAVSATAVLLALATLTPAPAAAQFALLPKLADRTIVLRSAPPLDRDLPVVRGSNVDDCDLISVRAEQYTPGYVRVEVRTAAPEMRKKTIEIAFNGQVTAETWAGGSNVGQPLVISPTRLRPALLVFVKPKLLGTPTRVYQLIGLEHAAGRKLIFTWQRDHC